MQSVSHWKRSLWRAACVRSGDFHCRIWLIRFKQQMVKPVCCLLELAGNKGELGEGRRMQRAGWAASSVSKEKRPADSSVSHTS